MNTLAIQDGKPVFKGKWPRWPVFDEQEVERVVSSLRSGNWSFEGPLELKFVSKFCDYLGVPYGVAVTNGTHALQLALEALDVGAGDEVIVPGLTWQATAACALDVNAVPVLVDIEAQSLCMDPMALRHAITPRTKAIIVVHLFGSTANMDEILNVANEFNIPVIEDCAHQHGGEWRGKKLGTLGTLGTFSMQQSKILSSGEGGFVCTSDKKLGIRLNALRHCGRPVAGQDPSDLSLQPQSGNYRFHEFQAALLLCGLDRLDEQNERRDANAQKLSGLLKEIKGITPPQRRPEVTRQAYYGYAFRYDENAFDGLNPQKFREALSAELNFSFNATYEPLNRSPLFKPLSKRRHHLDEEYKRRIDPSQYELPQCHKAFKEIAVGLHFFLLAKPECMEWVAESIAKIQKHASQFLTCEVIA